MASSVVVKKEGEPETTQQLVVSLCAQFYHLGWVTGTGGSISIRQGDRIFMTPSGVQKERLQPEDMFVLDLKGKVVEPPVGSESVEKPRLKLSQCAPLFQQAYSLREAGAVIHSHGMYCVLATVLCERQGVKEFRVQHQEMIKGLEGHGYHDTLVVPIIDNTAHEAELADSLAAAIKAYPRSNAVLVRRHGLYCWGSSWEKAKTQSECLHYLFECAVKMDSMLRVDPAAPPALWCNECEAAGTAADGVGGGGGGGGEGGGGGGGGGGGKKRRINGAASSSSGGGGAAETGRYEEVKVLLLDIEGTTTPISFVKDTLFPYSKKHMKAFLERNWENPQVDSIMYELNCIKDPSYARPKRFISPPPLDTASKVASFCCKLIRDDEKVTPLKELQGLVWREGYEKGELQGQLFSDVGDAFQRWSTGGEGVGRGGGGGGGIGGGKRVKSERTNSSKRRRIAIYSSGSRQAQRLLFQHSSLGDLTPCISCYFDTTTGHKQKEKSYRDIALSLGVEQASEVLFLTDVEGEAKAAREAGMQVVVVVRPGNAPLTKGHDFDVVEDFASLL